MDSRPPLLPALLGPLAATLALGALVVALLAALLGRLLHRATHSRGALGLLLAFAVLAAPGAPPPARRKPPSRDLSPACIHLLERMRDDTRAHLFPKDGTHAPTGSLPGAGRIVHALLTLLGLLPYPDDEKHRRDMEATLAAIAERAPDVAAFLGARMREHYLKTAKGGSDAAP